MFCRKQALLSYVLRWHWAELSFSGVQPHPPSFLNFPRNLNSPTTDESEAHVAQLTPLAVGMDVLPICYIPYLPLLNLHPLCVMAINKVCSVQWDSNNVGHSKMPTPPYLEKLCKYCS